MKVFIKKCKYCGTDVERATNRKINCCFNCKKRISKERALRLAKPLQKIKKVYVYKGVTYEK